jgi:LysM repeat protein
VHAVDRRELTRVVAPALLLVAATATVLLARSGLERRDGPAPRGRSPAVHVREPKSGATRAGQRPAEAKPPASPPVYVVRSGDTLSAIAERRATTVERLLALNPGVDPAGLTVGQRLRVP